MVRATHAVLMAEDGTIRIGDPTTEERIVAHFREVAEPEFECVMVGPDQSFRNVTRGAEGFLHAFADWFSPFDEFRIVVEETFDAGDDQVVDLVHQTGKTTRGGVEVETEGAAVWSFRGRALHRVEFHLDREAALRSAGLGEDP
jgi:ketosteroid isomerase-like protein